MNKKVIAVAVVSIIVLLAVVLWFFNKDKKTEQELTLYGNVDIRQISLAFEQTGRIQSLSVQEGDKVKKGQVLAELKTDALKIQEQQAEAQLNVQKQAMIEQEVGTRPEQITQAKAQLVSAQAQLGRVLNLT